MANNIIDLLNKTNSPANQKLARSIEKVQKHGISLEVVEEMLEDYNNKKAYSLFLKLIIPEQREVLLKAEKTIDNVSLQIERSARHKRNLHYTSTGYYDPWSMRENGAFGHIAYRNYGDPEFEERDHYIVLRGKNGYTCYRGNSIETDFYEKYKDKLEIIHEAYKIKEIILGGSFVLKDEKDRELACAILSFLGYDRYQKIYEEYKQENKNKSK